MHGELPWHSKFWVLITKEVSSSKEGGRAVGSPLFLWKILKLFKLPEEPHIKIVEYNSKVIVRIVSNSSKNVLP